MILTPKEKAQELVYSMYHITTTKKQAKQCALRAVELKLEGMIEECGDPITFWQQVKNEIKLL